MNKRYCYLAGPIAMCDKGEANDWREYVQSKLPKNIKGVSPLRCEPLIGDRYELIYDDPRFGTPGAIGGKNWFDTVNCDLILAYLPKEMNDRRPSYGTAFEIAWAMSLQKQTILVTDDDYLRNHPLVKFYVPWVVTTLDEALEIIEGVLSIYVED